MWIFWVYILNTIFMLIIAVCEVRRPARALNWLAIGLILPIIGFGFYLISSNPLRMRGDRLTSPHHESEKLQTSFSRSVSVIAHSLQQFTVHGLRSGRVQILTNGLETYEKLTEYLKNAHETIDLEYYIYRDDQIGTHITDLLIERAAAGVRVRFVRDGWGSRKFPQSQISRMIDAGIECRTIFPLRFPWIMSNWNSRDHCKIVVIDGKEAFTGGINVGYEYTGLKPNVGFWRDTHLLIEGEPVVDLHAIFKAHWKIATPERMTASTSRNTKGKGTRKSHQGASHSLQNTSVKGPLSGLSAKLGTELGTMERADVDHIPIAEELQNAYLQTLEGNPGLPTPVIRQAFFICLTQATQTIDITTPYFIPEADIIAAMKTAVARGVRVRLLVPRNVDQKIVGYASRTYYGELLEAGVQIYLYTKGMLHAKQMIIDGEIAEVGAANYDMRSFRLNYEVCALMYSAEVARDLTTQFERDLTESTPLRLKDLEQRSRSERMLEQGARLLAPLL